jgi:hypothetical protein
MAHSLHVSVGPAAGTAIQVAGELLIGRAVGGAGTLGNDPKLSRQHARIRQTGDGRLQLEDLGSTNGTFVNGQRVAGARVLGPGDRVQVGSTTLEVAHAPAPAAAPPPPVAAPAGPLPPTAPLTPPPAPASAPPPQPQYAAPRQQYAPQPQYPAPQGQFGAPAAAQPKQASNGLKLLAILGGALMLLWGLYVAGVAITILVADRLEEIGGQLYEITSTDKLIVGLFGIPSAVTGIGTLVAAIAYAITDRRGKLVPILAGVSIVLGLIGYLVLDSTAS